MNNIGKKYTMNLLVYFAQDEPLMKKILWRDFGKGKGENSISGICIQIDRELAFSGLFGTGKKTDYGSPVSFNPFLYFNLTQKQKYAREFLFTLPADFCEENEYRIIRLFTKNESREIPIPKESIKLIILHPKMGPTKIKEIKESVQSILPDTEIKQLKKRGSEYN